MRAKRKAGKVPPSERRFAVGLDLMTAKFRVRTIMVAPVMASGLFVAGCVGAPTYGTDKTATEQLTSDISGMFSMKPRSTGVSDYKPRPELVKPASLNQLPAPQEKVASIDNPAWPESPEQRRARIRADASANQDDNLYEPLIVNDLPVKSTFSGKTPEQLQDEMSAPMSNSESKAQTAEVNRRKVEANQGLPTKRKYLSEPPLEYRTPSQTAAVGELGEDEAKKERRIRKAATKKGDSRWRDLVPWL